MRRKIGETRLCKLCGTPFYRKRSAILKGGGVYCSRKCSRYVEPNRIIELGDFCLLEVESRSRGFTGYAKIDWLDVPIILSFNRRWCAAWHHINHDMLDCRRSNLRLCTRGENLQNRKGPQSTSTTGIRGVHFNTSSGKYSAELKINNKKIFLGYFTDIQEAERVAIAGRKRYMTHCAENL